jgi:hypothetical protein
MGESMKEIGLIIKCRVRVLILGQTVGDMRDHMKEIRKMALEYINGLMVEFMKVHGTKVNNMVKENILQLKVKKDMDSGRTANVLNG